MKLAAFAVTLALAGSAHAQTVPAPAPAPAPTPQIAIAPTEPVAMFKAVCIGGQARLSRKWATATRYAAIPADAVPPATVPARRSFSRAGMIFPDSDRRLLGPGDVARLSLSELRVARNEIYARRGRAFADPALRRYFGQFDWYQPVVAEVALNRVENANVAFLQAAEAGK